MKHEILVPLSADAKSNPRAASVRIRAKSLSRAFGQRRHDMRIGRQPDYVDAARRTLNRDLVVLRPLREIQRENNALRDARGCVRKMKSDAAAVMTGIITFGHQAQVMFACLSTDQQDAAYLALAERIAKRLGTRVESLNVHADESADHAHFMLRGYTDDGQPVSKVATYAVVAELQDITAKVMQAYCPDIERGHKKWGRIDKGADCADTLNRSVKQLHQDLPLEISARQAELQRLVDEVVDLQNSIAKTQRQSANMQARRDKTAQQLKTARVYAERLTTKEAALVKLTATCDQARVDITAMQEALEAKQIEAEERDTVHRQDVRAHSDNTAAQNAKIAEEHAVLAQMQKSHTEHVRNDQAVAAELAVALQAKQDFLARQEQAIEGAAKAKLDEIAAVLKAATRKAEQADLARQADDDAAEAARWAESSARSAAERAHAEKVAAQAVTAEQAQALRRMRAEMKEEIAQLNTIRASLSKQREELKTGIFAFKAVIDEFWAGTLKRDQDGRVQMKDRTPITAAPEWTRSVLSTLCEELVGVREEIAAVRSNLEAHISKIAVFLKRKDLTVDAQNEAGSLRDHTPGDDF